MANKSSDKTVIYDFNTYKNLQSSHGIPIESQAKHSNNFTLAKRVPFLKSQIKSVYDSTHHPKRNKEALNSVNNFSQMSDISLTDLKRLNNLSRQKQHENLLSPSLTIKKLN